MVYVAVDPQTGRVSKFGYAKQVSKGTYVAPTDVLETTSFDTTDNSNVLIYETLNGSLDSQSHARTGIHSVDAKASSDFFGIQGMGLWKAAIGADVGNAAAVSFGALSGSTYAVGSTSLTFAGSLPALPAGVADWRGFWIEIGSGATKDRSPILNVSTNTIQVLPTKFSHPITDSGSVPVARVFQPNTGANVTNLDWISLCFQYGQMLERQLLDCRVDKITLKSDAQKVSTDFEFASDSLPGYEGVVTTTITSAAGEAADNPYVAQDGGLITPFNPADTTPIFQMHARLTTLQYDLSYALQKEKVGGGVQLAEMNVLGARTQKLTFEELAGQDGGTLQMHKNYLTAAATTNELPAFISYYNAKNGTYFSAFFPRCVLNAFDPVGPTDRPIMYKGDMTPLLDEAGTGIPMRIIAQNGVSVAL